MLVGAMLMPATLITPEQGWDKIIHFGVFALWAMLAVFAMPEEPRRQGPRILLLGLALALGTEAAQAFITVLNRTGDPIDGLADMLGVGAGLMGLAVRWERRPAREEAR